MIILDHVTKGYQGRSAVQDLSLKVPPGSAFGLLGQNGAGKTTTMKMVVGLTAPDSGTVTVSGRQPMQDMSIRAVMGYMPESPYFYERLNAEEFLRFCASLFHKSLSGEECVKLLEEVGLDSVGRKPIGAYSKGMKQRLGFAQAIVNDPDYVFLDEPLDGLDPIGRKEIKDIILSLRQRGKTIFFNSHILYDTEELCDEIGILHEGRLVYAGPLREFTAGRPLEKRFIEEVGGLAQKY